MDGLFQMRAKFRMPGKVCMDALLKSGKARIHIESLSFPSSFWH